MKSIRDPRTFPAFLYATARRTALARLRSHDFDTTAELPDPPDDATDEAVDLFDNADAVHTALDQLPLVHREILTLFFLRDLSLMEIAAVLGVPEGTVKSRLHYAKRSIKQILIQQGASNVTR